MRGSDVAYAIVDVVIGKGFDHIVDCAVRVVPVRVWERDA